MITFHGDDYTFTYRVAAVIVNDGRVLLQQFENVDWWCLPGGRVEMGEPSTVAIHREMREEIGSDVRVGRLVWIVENFYRDEVGGTLQHEIGLYFDVALPEEFSGRRTVEFSGSEGDMVLRFRWFRVSELAGVPVLPIFLQRALQHELPGSPVHIINLEPNSGQQNGTSGRR